MNSTLVKCTGIRKSRYFTTLRFIYIYTHICVCVCVCVCVCDNIDLCVMVHNVSILTQCYRCAMLYTYV